jgi:uncharacterized membrane protein YeaQ/YmgE (transglycosylase-associated protein family)
MGIIYALIVGLIVGVLAKFFMPGKDPGGLILTALLGVAGAMVALLIGRTMGFYGDSGETPGIIAAIVGAMVVLGGYRALTKPKHA